jgi:hypothetical protein
MISSVSIQSIKGVLTLVQTIVYKNGKQVKRVLNPHTKVPIGIIEEKA